MVPLGPEGQVVRRQPPAQALESESLKFKSCAASVQSHEFQASTGHLFVIPSSINRGLGRTHFLGLLSEDVQAKYQPRTIGGLAYTGAQ